MSLALYICSLPLFRIGWKWFSTTHGGHFKKFPDMIGNNGDLSEESVDYLRYKSEVALNILQMSCLVYNIPSSARFPYNPMH